MVRQLLVVLAAYLVLLLVTTALFAYVENLPSDKALWWAIVTSSTVGYGDVIPKTQIGSILASILMLTSNWVFSPMIAGIVAAKLIVNSDAFTHSEQEEIKAMLRKLFASKPPPAPNIQPQSAYQRSQIEQRMAVLSKEDWSIIIQGLEDDLDQGHPSTRDDANAQNPNALHYVNLVEDLKQQVFHEVLT